MKLSVGTTLWLIACLLLSSCEPVPTPLTANYATLQTMQNTPVDLTLTVAGGDPTKSLTYQVGVPSNGTITGSAPNISYAPNIGFSGTDTFTFSVSDGTVTSNTATITIFVQAVPLTAVGQTLQTAYNTPLNIVFGVTGGGAPQNFTYLVSKPQNGTISGTAPNVTYTPALNFFGDDSFTFSVADGTTISNTAVVTVKVSALPILVEAQTVQTTQNIPVDIFLSASGGVTSNITYQVGLPTNGSLTGVAPNLTYTPELDYSGTDTFTYSASDGLVTSNTASVTINVSSAPPPPLFPISLVGAVPEEATITVDVVRFGAAVIGVVTLTVNDADFPDEGELVINGNLPIPLFGADGVSANDRLTTTVVLNTPATHWNNGENTLTFRHLNTAGYTIEDAIITFQ